MSHPIQISSSPSGTTPSADGVRVLTADALAFVASLAQKFEPERRALLARRRERDREIAAGAVYDFPLETASVRAGGFRVAAAPRDLEKRHVEITGPVERKMIINALNSGADVFMADFEDSLSPTWENVVSGQANLIDAVRRSIELDAGGKTYRLESDVATLVVRPRGWHLTEKHAVIDGSPVSASLFDFGVYFYHNARELLNRSSGPYFYLPKLESHREARLWNDVFVEAQESLGIPRGSVRATVLIETLPAAFEMDEILYELRDHASGLNAGRWDYLFSSIKKLRHSRDLRIPDRAQLTMTVPFMRAYTELLVRTCHRRGAHAMGGMAPFIPSRKQPQINEAALAKVRADKEREVGDGFDGTWVAHPDLVPTAREVFSKHLGSTSHQKTRLRDDVVPNAAALRDTHVPGGTTTEAGVRNDVSVALQYLAAWFAGNGAVAIFNLMEDAATAEISRAQLWFWLHRQAELDGGRRFGPELYRQWKAEELAALEQAAPDMRWPEASELLDELVLSDDFAEFLTLGAYQKLA
ncbi:MAG TPA: malate synthase A [Polyangiaceae bacterium]|nr:malate synthase A [Polyangiaceae bacterium]